jgi:hypothetical protein
MQAELDGGGEENSLEGPSASSGSSQGVNQASLAHKLDTPPSSSLPDELFEAGSESDEPAVEEVEESEVKVATMQAEVTAIEKQIEELEQQKIAFATAKKFRDAGAAKVKISTTHSLYNMNRLSARC